MKRASIRDLHVRTSEIVAEAAEGHIIVIEKRGSPVAELRPLQRRPRPDILPEMKALWRRMPRIKSDSTRIISEDLDR